MKALLEISSRPQVTQWAVRRAEQCFFSTGSRLNHVLNDDSPKNIQDVVIIGIARTPVGSFQGTLSSCSATQLGSVAIRGALTRSGIRGDQVDSVYFGNVLSAGLGQAPCRQAALGAGIDVSASCTTINKVCASSLKAIMLAAQSVALGFSDVAIAGGMESMSNAPYIVTRQLPFRKIGNSEMKDSLVKDGLRDAYEEVHMGSLADRCAQSMQISRSDQDMYAIRSYQRAATAQATGLLATEIVPVSLPSSRERAAAIVSADEEISRLDPEKLRQLPSVFSPNGTITAGNASKISDGAAAVVLVSARFAEENGHKVLGHIRGFADAAQAPEDFVTTPALAIPKALRRAGLSMNDAELFEINEAFSVVALANERLLGLDEDQLNIHGGAVSLGHPIGASGARILGSLLTGLALRGDHIGVASICNGGGGASALVVQRDPSFRLHKHKHGSWSAREHPAETAGA